MVAGSSQGNLGTNTVTSQSGHTNLMLVHKSGNVISAFFPSEELGVIRVAEITRVEDVDISLVDDFVERV